MFSPKRSYFWRFYLCISTQILGHIKMDIIYPDPIFISQLRVFLALTVPGVLGASPPPTVQECRTYDHRTTLCVYGGGLSKALVGVGARVHVKARLSGPGNSRRFMKQKSLSPVIHVDDSENLMLLRFIYQHTSSYIIIYQHISTYIIIYHHISSYIIIYLHDSS